MVPAGVKSVIVLGILLFFLSIVMLKGGEFLINNANTNSLFGSISYYTGEIMVQFSPILLAASMFFMAFIVFALIFMAPGFLEEITTPIGSAGLVARIIPPLIGWIVCQAFMTPEGVLMPLTMFGSFLKSIAGEMNPDMLEFLLGVLAVQAYFISIGISIVSIGYAIKFITALAQSHWSPSQSPHGRLAGAVLAMLLSLGLLLNLGTIVTIFVKIPDLSPASFLAGMRKYWNVGTNTASTLSGGG